MKKHHLWAIILVAITLNIHAADKTPAPSHGIDYPVGWQNWATIAVSHRTDNNTIRTILGNDVAVKAARAGSTNPWPDGTVLGKVVWKDTQLEDWKTATAPGKFVHAEFMWKTGRPLLHQESSSMLSSCSKTQKNIATVMAGAGLAG